MEVSPLLVVMVSVAPWKLGVDRPGVTFTDVTVEPEPSSAAGTARHQFTAWAARQHLRAAHAHCLTTGRQMILHVSITLGATFASNQALPMEEERACSTQQPAGRHWAALVSSPMSHTVRLAHTAASCTQLAVLGKQLTLQDCAGVRQGRQRACVHPCEAGN